MPMINNYFIVVTSLLAALVGITSIALTHAGSATINTNETNSNVTQPYANQTYNNTGSDAGVVGIGIRH